MGRDDRAVEHFEAARRLQPGSQNVLRQLADLYDRAGRKDKADEARQALQSTDTQQAVAAAEER
jgi:Flp pilus assembly protein TadD